MMDFEQSDKNNWRLPPEEAKRMITNEMQKNLDRAENQKEQNKEIINEAEKLYEKNIKHI